MPQITGASSMHPPSWLTTSPTICSSKVWTVWNYGYTSSSTTDTGTLGYTSTVGGTAGGGGSAGILILDDSNTTTGSSTGSAWPWPAWNKAWGSGGTASATTITHDPWIVWNRRQYIEKVRREANEHARQLANQPRISDEEFQARRQRAEEVMRRRAAELKAEQEAIARAKERARIILDENLTAAQREELAAKSYFTISTIRPDGERRYYQIRRGRSRNVSKVDANGKHLGFCCIHPAENVPDEDTMLAQLLMLRSGMEDEFLRIANHS